MAAFGGPVREVSFAGRRFAVDSESTGNRKIGGFENERKPNGDGTTRNTQKRVVWTMSGLNISIDDERGDQEFLQDQADNGGDKVCTFKFANNSTWRGKGNIEGEIAFDTANAVAGITFTGPGKLEQQ